MLFCFLSAMVWAHESTPNAIVVSDEVTLFEALELDSGWVPEDGNLGVRVQISAVGTADVDMEGQSHLEWPPELELSFSGEDGGGRIGLDTELEATVFVRFDISGYEWDSEIASRSITVSGETVFQPFAVGEELTVDTLPSSDPVIEYDTTVLAVVDVSFTGDLNPNCSLVFQGLSWDIGDESITTGGEAASFTPAAGTTSFEPSAVYNADFDIQCSLNFVPTFSVCVPVFGCTDWEPTQVEVDDLEANVSHSFPANALQFPLPAMENVDSLDFGTVALNNTANAELLIDNVGQLLLEGKATLADDSGAFSLFGANVTVPPGGTDGLVFAFNGDEIGEYSATVTIESNDPAQPSKTIALTANVTETGEPGAKVDGGCGCSAADTNYPNPLAFLLPLLVVGRRKE